VVKLICRTGKEKTQATQKRYKKIVVPKTAVGGIVFYSTARVTDATDEERVKTEEKSEGMLFWTKSFLDDMSGQKEKKR